MAASVLFALALAGAAAGGEMPAIPAPWRIPAGEKSSIDLAARSAADAWLRHPILGDQFYATGEALAAADRLQLHAEELGFNHPRGGWVEFRVPAPF